jgi:hypothetical protein
MTVDASRCPDCGEALAGATHCPSCGLLLRGPYAARLWQVSRQIDDLERTRASLIEALRPGGVAAAPPEPVRAPARPAAARAAGATGTAAVERPVMSPDAWAMPKDRPRPPYDPAPRPRPRKEWTPQRVQNVLLSTGALLLVVAAIAFTAFTWGKLPIGARAAIMVALTAVTGWSARWVHRRGLEASAEAIALLAVLFAVIDVYAAHRANLAGLHSTDVATYWSVASALLAAGAAAFARVVPVRSVRYAALAGAQVPLAITAFRLPGLTYAERGAFLGVQAAVLAVGASRLGGTAIAARVSALGNWAVAGVLALSTAYATSDLGDVRVAALVLVGLGAVALLAPGPRALPGGVLTLAVVLAVVAPARLTLTFVQLPLAVSAIGLVAVVAAALAPRAWRDGPAVVGTGTVGLAVLAVSPWVMQVLVAPLTWVEQPWTLAGDRAARLALAADGISPDGTEWGGSVVTLAVMVVAAAAAVVVAYAYGSLSRARWWVVGLVSVAVLLVPLGLAWSYRGALTWYVLAGVGGLAASYLLRRVVVAAPTTVVLAVAAVWSLASEGATLVVLLVVALAYAAYASLFDRPREAAAGVAAAAGAAYAVALAASRGAPTDRIGFVLAGAAFALLAAAAVLPGIRSVEGVAAAAYVVALPLSATGDLGWLAWTLGGGAVAAGGTAFRPGRRMVAGVAALLTTGCAAATSTAYGLPLERTGLVVALTACGVFAAGRLAKLGDVALVGVGAYVLGAMVTVTDPAWLAWALGAGALTAGAAAYADRLYTPVAAGLAIACAGVTSYALGAPDPRTGFVVALAACAAVGLGVLVRGRDGERVEWVAAAAYLASIAIASQDLGWLSWILLAGGLTALADGLRPERRDLRHVATVLLTAWSWDRLWLADIEVPEAYAAPVAVLLLVLGHLQRRREPSTGSWPAYGRGLAVAFAPTTLLVLTDPGVTRPVLLAVAGAAVLLAGVKERLQAPLTIGAAALAVDALVQFGPVAAAMPKWASIGAVGLLVIAVGVTYEDRRRDMARLRETFDSLA